MEPLSPGARATLDAYRREHAPDPRMLQAMQHRLAARGPTPRRAPLRLVAASALTIAVVTLLGSRSTPVARTLEHELIRTAPASEPIALVMPREVTRVEPRAKLPIARAPAVPVVTDEVHAEEPVEVIEPVAEIAAPVYLAPAPKPRSVRTESSTLDAEVMQLRTAHDLLREGEPLRALSALREHARRFPDGKLHELASVTRVLALCELERRDEARREADAVLRDHPNSVHASRVRDACK